MKKYVINLLRRPDRLRTFKSRCPFDDVNVEYGFDGKNPKESIQNEIEFNWFHTILKLSSGEKGCFISHLRILKKIIDEQIPLALIFEDDALFKKTFLPELTQALLKLPKDFHILYVGGRFVPNYKTDTNEKYKVISKQITQSLPPFTVEHDRTAHAYVISLAGAKYIFNKFKSFHQICRPIDYWLLRILVNIPIYNTNPLLCHSPLGSDSDIR